jgi:hypothetical protein
VKLSVSIDLNDEVVAKLSMHTDDINRYIESHRGQIVEAAQAASGKKIVQLLQAYAEEFVVPASRAEELLGPEAMADAKRRWDELQEQEAKAFEMPPRPDEKPPLGLD